MEGRYNMNYNTNSTSYDDRERCHFYYKVGVCRHGNKCSKKHIPPANSRSIVVLNMIAFQSDGTRMSDVDFDGYYEDVFIELCKFGKIKSFLITENGNDHLRGNVYALYDNVRSAKEARDSLNTRWYNEKPLYSDLTHIVDFNDAICRKYDVGSCDRGNECNFMHVRRPSPSLKSDLDRSQAKKWQSQGQN
ncbi:hypothetical protein Kpol_455p4 [Vanderwaltozyma polyspora DSM 70294]|uniref:C3H1-type domain-containing protein n=1 Tax=Vanderwaltozyma polyspora (strain ATCC 22028 / DSM 70294 / BCRC 21397 / CBS 2163 / NBRC 10782 / NRRL Y-8283 / UCD 57-17) TaxID=436907 RepID=A7TR25_VANPO|nr:uncharacterized protein Kpol_455p4 [Vanderwaltozyma polyspora DSM 70294]EDO15273.1 hypothetical protein Kpol_455p4 [Vanderwaltozyma polyspora DSM 70294]